MPRPSDTSTACKCGHTCDEHAWNGSYCCEPGCGCLYYLTPAEDAERSKRLAGPT